MEGDDKQTEMLEDFPDEHSGFHVDRSVYDGYRD
jgi:hypothetical protein